MNLIQYSQSIEARAQWLLWAARESDNIREAFMHGKPTPEYKDILPAYVDVLQRGDTFYMDTHFEKLVNHARLDIPDNIAFDARWLQSPCGFLYLEDPFEVPALKAFEDKCMKIRAIGWRSLPAGSKMLVGPSRHEQILTAAATQFLFYQDFPYKQGFGCWSYLSITDGDCLGDRIDDFEKHATGVAGSGEYVDCTHRVIHQLHEVRWLYAALHLMAQKYAITVHHKPDRATRRRAIKEKRKEPSLIKVITLRRLAEPRSVTLAGKSDREYTCQWEVRGHWRNQFYPSEGIHKHCYIDPYVKGPEDKPFKASGAKLFAAVR